MSELDSAKQTQAQIAAFQYKLELIKEQARIQAEIDEREAKRNDIVAAIEQINAGQYDSIPSIPIKRGRGRPKGSKNKPKEINQTATVGVAKARNDNNLRGVISGILEKNKPGLVLADLLRKARESGYTAKGKQDFPKLVLDTVKDLMANPENGKPVLYDKETKTYSLAA